MSAFHIFMHYETVPHSKDHISGAARYISLKFDLNKMFGYEEPFLRQILL